MADWKLADDVSTSWERLLDGRSAAGPITAFDPHEFRVRFACEARDFDPARWMGAGATGEVVLDEKEACSGCRRAGCLLLVGYLTRSA
jgi:3-oxoacyl-(acyl-carrier-protein) synthase